MKIRKKKNINCIFFFLKYIFIYIFTRAGHQQNRTEIIPYKS